MKNVSFISGNILNKESVDSATKGIDVVVHLATSHNRGKEERNIEGSKNIINACKERKVKKFIFISSMAAKRKNLDAYGKTKLKIEKIIKSSGLKYVILRLGIIYSEDNLSLIGKSLKFPLIIPIIGSGKYKINPVYIEDVVEVIAVATKNKKAIGKEYDIAGAENISFNEVIEICKEKFKIRKLNLHIPIFLAALVFRFVPITSIESVKGIEEDTNADIAGMIKDLKINPINFKEKIKNVTI